MVARNEKPNKQEHQEDAGAATEGAISYEPNPSTSNAGTLQGGYGGSALKSSIPAHSIYPCPATAEHKTNRCCDSNGERLGEREFPNTNSSNNDNASISKMTIRVGLDSSCGYRSGNDDWAMADTTTDCYVISDGIGGARDGNIMSRVGCGAFIEEYRHSGDLTKAFLASANAAARVSNWISNPDCGATLLAASIRNGLFYVVWVGDSVVYRLRDSQLYLLAKPDRIEGTNALGSAIGQEIHPTFFSAECDVRPGDRFLLCTDGVWETYAGKLSPSRLAEQLSQDLNAPMAARRICEEASRAGDDNATAIVLIVTDYDKGFELGTTAGTLSLTPTPTFLPETPQYLEADSDHFYINSENVGGLSAVGGDVSWAAQLTSEAMTPKDSRGMSTTLRKPKNYHLD